MEKWYMLTVVGADRPGIVARLARELFALGANLGEASMLRLGGNFTIMLMVHTDLDARALEARLAPASADLNLRLHVDPIEGRLHQHVQPEVRIRVHEADRAGIVAEVSEALADIGFNILALDTDVAGADDAPWYVIQIEGVAPSGLEAVAAALEPLRGRGVELGVEAIDTMVG